MADRKLNKTTRTHAIIREYQRRHPGSFSTGEVAEWGLARGLFPVPGRLKREEEWAAEWDRRFAEICEEETKNVPADDADQRG